MRRKTLDHCQLCRSTESLLPATSLNPALVRHIRTEHPDWDRHGGICRSCLLARRTTLAIEKLTHDRGDLDAIESEIAKKAEEHVAVADHFDEEFDRTATFGDRAADMVSRLGGSWTFVLLLSGLLAGWVLTNLALGKDRAFDPFPFILLNLALSTIAAFQAPIILMASNRAAARDRSKADQDFRVNLKAELEVASLHDKLDHLLHVQWERMVEVQEIQLELLTEIRAHAQGKEPPSLQSLLPEHDAKG